MKPPSRPRTWPQSLDEPATLSQLMRAARELSLKMQKIAQIPPGVIVERDDAGSR